MQEQWVVNQSTPTRAGDDIAIACHPAAEPRTRKGVVDDAILPTI